MGATLLSLVRWDLRDTAMLGISLGESNTHAWIMANWAGQFGAELLRDIIYGLP